MYKKIIALICVLATILLVWQMPALLSNYPINRDGDIHNKQWEGVVRVWVCQDLRSSFNSWLSKQIAAFEKANKSVNVRVMNVRPNEWEREGVVLPDVLLFSCGTMNDPENWLIPFGQTDLFQAEALRSARWMGEQYALPVAMGGYAVMYNDSIFPLGSELTNPASVKKQPRYALHASGSSALAALLGWADGVDAVRSLKLPNNFGTATNDQVYAAFTAGNIGAIVTPVDYVRKFAAREAAGKGFTYHVETPLSGFNDQLIYIARMDNGTVAARQAMADKLVWYLTSKSSQDALPQYGLLPTLIGSTPPGKSAPTLAALFDTYQDSLAAPNTFGWQAVKQDFINQSLHALKNDVSAIDDTIEMVR
ncbi:hypothetical protein FACS18948_0200 [Clostridia bacterium]|nr:hypothetical protein FACS18948_0200 [Clostridia bacterium]